MYALICPVCGEMDNLSHFGNTFVCNQCDSDTEFEDMDFWYLEE